MTHDEIVKKAREEVAEERIRALIDAEKIRIRSKRSLLDRLFPFTITIRRKA